MKHGLHIIYHTIVLLHLSFVIHLSSYIKKMYITPNSHIFFLLLLREVIS